MAKVDDSGTPNFDDFDDLGEQPPTTESPGEALPEGVDSAAGDILTTGETTEIDSAGDVDEEPEQEKPPAKWPLYLEWGLAVLLPLSVLGFAWYQQSYNVGNEALYFSTALYIIALGFIAYGVWKGRATNNVYSVIVACALAAVLTALYFLWTEIGRYNFDIKAQDAKQRVVMSAVFDRGDLL